MNYGLSIVEGEVVHIYWGKLEADSKLPGHRGVAAYNFIQSIQWGERCSAIIEGAAYKTRFGQVGLEEVRFGFFLSLYHLGFDVRIVAPATIRLKVFGHGNQQAGEVWPTLNHNAADSLSMALLALQ